MKAAEKRIYKNNIHELQILAKKTPICLYSEYVACHNVERALLRKIVKRRKHSTVNLNATVSTTTLDEGVYEDDEVVNNNNDKMKSKNV